MASVLVACGSISSKPVEWQTAQDASNDQSLKISFGLDSCQDFDRAEVAYSRTAVTVTLFAVPNHNTCTGLRFVRTVDVPLRQSLAGRDVRDGAKTR
jgi:hypothetical protein